MWAKELHIIIGHPSTAGYIKMVQTNILPYSPDIPSDIQAAEMSFNLDIGALKGKSTCC